MKIMVNQAVEGTNLPRLDGEQADIYPGSPMAVIGVWLYAVRSRFADLAAQPLPWVWDPQLRPFDTETGEPRSEEDGVPAKIMIEAAYNVEKAARNYRPAVYVGRGGNAMQFVKQAVNNFVGMERPTRHKAYHGMVSMPLVFECESDNAAESSTIGETVWGFVLSTREIFRKDFGFHEIEEPVLGDTMPSKVDKEVWVTTVQTRVMFDMRWSVTPIAPKLRDIWLELREKDNPEELYAKLSMYDGVED